MPTVLRVAGYRFFFYSNERGEPAHIHVEQAERTAKYWLDPLELAESHGFRSQELAEIIGRVDAKHRDRVGVCVDTCHVHAAGYDLVNDYDGVMARLADTLGLGRLRVMHLNDSKTPFASRRDRHELIAEGSLGEGPFRRIMTDARLAAVPKVIETPKLDDATATDARMLALLRGYAEG